ncbi:MAG: PD40 domain-containing protein [Rhizobacter sp.]|nr:PD40 domain-containing protein [Chlorobiales bacterium]
MRQSLPASTPSGAATEPQTDLRFNAATLLYPGEEKFLANVKQLTSEGENAEAYLSFDNTQLVFQTHVAAAGCDQIYTMNLDGSHKKLVSTGKGRTTCSYFLPDGKSILYASTHLADEKCPPPPDFSKGYTWALYKGYDIFFASLDSLGDGQNVRRITATDGYDAEATVSPTGDKIIFTSVRDGDLELYEMDITGNRVKRLTTHTGYDGGAFYSPDGQKIVFRASTPKDAAEEKSYKELLAAGLIRPTKLDIFTMNSDGSGRRQLTDNGKANFAPFFLPNNRQIIFSSNLSDERGRNFDLYLINDDGSALTRISFGPEFEGFPVFTKDGKKIIFSSNRNSKQRGETNVFIADWIYKGN